jgi:hypothetical protein
MLCVDIAGDKLGTLAHDFRQNSFTISINRCDLNEVNDASPCTHGVVRFSPGPLKFSRPFTNQLTLQGPPLLVSQIG